MKPCATIGCTNRAVVTLRVKNQGYLQTCARCLEDDWTFIELTEKGKEAIK